MSRKKKNEEVSSRITEKTEKKKAVKPKVLPEKKTPAAKKQVQKTTKAEKSVKEESPAKSLKPPSAFTPPKAKSPSPARTSGGKLPRYGETQVVAFIRDPHCIYTYWEVAPESVEAVKRQLKEEFKNSHMVLRVFKTNAEGLAEFLYEIEVAPESMNRYLEVDGESRGYFVEVAQKTPSGEYIVYARSHTLTLPNGSPSAADPQWTPPAELEEYFTEEVTEEGGLSSAQGRRGKWRGFPVSSQR